MDKLGSAERPFFFDALHIFVLCGLAVAQPLYDLLGSNAEFFVAHRLSPSGILTFTAVLSVALPLALIAIEGCVGLLSQSVRRWFHLLLVTLLAALLFAMLLKRVANLPASINLGAAVVLGAVFAAAYSRLSAVQSFLTVLSPSGLAFPLLFLAFTPVSGLVFANQQITQSRGVQPTTKSPVPIVFIVFDEFEASALLDDKKEIDSVRFPNFAALAKSGQWFPNATTVWTETQRAIPAILTGLRPRDPSALPSVQSYPDNLFTWLSRAGYELNVSEPLTSLCPRNLCRAPESGRTEFDGEMFLSDLRVIFLHLMLPTSYAERYLPRMDAGWRGFASESAKAQENASDQKNFRAEFHEIVVGDRRPLLTNFIESIKPSEKPTLYFLHVLLPHEPYLYLPSGSMYFGGNTEGVIDRAWIKDDLFPTLAYQRYMMQVGFVDTTIGRLIAHLKSVGLYDSSLIVLTADHGKSFLPGHPKRTLVPNALDHASDLIQVPLFIKLPGQTKGERSERRALTIDILPTIAEVLGTELPWRADGVSLLQESFPARDILEITHLGETSGAHRFDAERLTSYPHLDWKIQTFGSRTPLQRVAAADLHSTLVGKRLADFHTSATANELRVESDRYGDLANVRPSSGIVPTFFSGRIEGVHTKTPLRLAVAVNGVVRVTTRTTAWAGADHHFAVMIPEEAFQEGRNVVDVVRIDEVVDHIELTPVASPGQEHFQIQHDAKGNEILMTEAGLLLRVQPELVRGHLDAVQEKSRWLTLNGWAVDVERLAPAERVLVFVDGKQVYSGSPSRGRPDLVKSFQSENVLWSGFRFDVPKAAFGTKDSEIRVYAVSNTGSASRLIISEPTRGRLAEAYK